MNKIATILSISTFTLVLGIYLGFVFGDNPVVTKIANQPMTNFLKPYECSDWQNKPCNATDYMKPYRVYVLQTGEEVKFAFDEAQQGNILDISDSYPWQVGDIIKYDQDNRAYIRISKDSPSHYQDLDKEL